MGWDEMTSRAIWICIDFSNRDSSSNSSNEVSEISAVKFFHFPLLKGVYFPRRSKGRYKCFLSTPYQRHGSQSKTTNFS